MVIFALAIVVAVASAIRSTWSPCGVSMLSTITPMTESARGNRFRTTAWWYVLGGSVGGVMLGGVIALLAVPVMTWQPSATVRLLLVAAAALASVASDGRLFGFQLPGHDRQVNERWLDQYRSWVYGGGFGWQIGFGLSTYIMTAGVYLLVLLGALTGSPVSALLLGTVFGLIRGMAVFAASELKDSQALAAFHQRFESWRQPVRRGMITVLAVVGIIAGISADSPAGVVMAGLTMIVAVLVVRSNSEISYRIRAAGEITS